jgi:CspA family cold shock protein
MTEQGTVRWYNAKKGIGFIVRDGGGADVVFSGAAIVGEPQTLDEGQRVSFVLAEGPKGSYAIQVTRIS